MASQKGKIGKFTAKELKQVAERKLDEFREALIEEVRDMEFVYNREHPRHMDKGLTNKTWMEISKSLGHPIPECESEWKKLREAFCRERKVRNGTVSGQGQCSKRKEFKFYHALMFLDKFIKPRKSRTTIGDYQASDEEDESQPQDPGEAQPMEVVDAFSFPIDDPELTVLVGGKSKSPRSATKRQVETTPPVLRKSPRKTLFVGECSSQAPMRNPAERSQATPKSPRANPHQSPKSSQEERTSPQKTPPKSKEKHVLTPHLPVLSPPKDYKENAKSVKSIKAKTDALIGEALTKSLSTLTEIASRSVTSNQESKPATMEAALGNTIGDTLSKLPTAKLRREWRDKFNDVLDELVEFLEK